MYDKKLIQDFKKKDPHKKMEFWYVQYGDYCRYNKREHAKTYKEYEDIMEKVYRMYVYENKLFSENEQGETIIVDANEVLNFSINNAKS